ncbi:MAG: glycosyltransferase [Chryseolinea sp.]
MDSLLFSIITPTYNRATSIYNLILSVQSQSDENFELIIVDDGSTDDTRKVVKPFLNDQRISYIWQDNRERGAARNTGARAATGKYLNFFDSDDLMLSNHIEAARQFLQEKGEIDFFHTCYEIVDEKGIILLRENGQEERRAADRLIRTNYLACNSVFAKRTFFEQNTFNEDRKLSSSEDWELWLRMISRVQLFRCPKVTFKIVNHKNRSLANLSADQIVSRDMSMLSYLVSDQPFVRTFKNELAIFESDRYTFFALAFCQERNWNKTLHYLYMATLLTPKVFLRKRFWATAKNLVNGYLHW